MSAKMAMFSESRPRLNRAIVCQQVKPVGEPGTDRRVGPREIRTPGSMSGSVETEYGEASEAPATERVGNR